jgi:hypothetical protein
MSRLGNRIVLYCTALCFDVLQRTVLCNIISYSIVLPCFAVYFCLFYCIVLHRTALYWCVMRSAPHSIVYLAYLELYFALLSCSHCTVLH